jgi:hypothetical protein
LQGRRAREDAGIAYSVRVSYDNPSAFEEGESEVCVWSEFVYVGQTDATVAGGAAFVQMAREQERVVDLWVAHIRGLR